MRERDVEFPCSPTNSCCCGFFFFFSSRRRHTSFDCDWSSDVCSSDLSRAGVREPQDFRATSLETLRQMVATGAGVTLLPELAVRGAYRGARGVALRPLDRKSVV